METSKKIRGSGGTSASLELGGHHHHHHDHTHQYSNRHTTHNQHHTHTNHHTNRTNQSSRDESSNRLHHQYSQVQKQANHGGGGRRSSSLTGPVAGWLFRKNRPASGVAVMPPPPPPPKSPPASPDSLSQSPVPILKSSNKASSSSASAAGQLSLSGRHPHLCLVAKSLCVSLVLASLVLLSVPRLTHSGNTIIESPSSSSQSTSSSESGHIQTGGTDHHGALPAAQPIIFKPSHYVSSFYEQSLLDHHQQQQKLEQQQQQQQQQQHQKRDAPNEVHHARPQDALPPQERVQIEPRMGLAVSEAGGAAEPVVVSSSHVPRMSVPKDADGWHSVYGNGAVDDTSEEDRDKLYQMHLWLHEPSIEDHRPLPEHLLTDLHATRPHGDDDRRDPMETSGSSRAGSVRHHQAAAAGSTISESKIASLNADHPQADALKNPNGSPQAKSAATETTTVAASAAASGPSAAAVASAKPKSQSSPQAASQSSPSVSNAAPPKVKKGSRRTYSGAGRKTMDASSSLPRPQAQTGNDDGDGGDEDDSNPSGTTKTPPCAHHGRYYCSHKEDYPIKVVTEVTKYYKWPLEKLFRDLRHQVMPKLASDSYGGLVCDAITRVVRPGWARNTNNRWLVVINTDQYQQYVTEVICRHGSGASCNFIPPCYAATCRQRYNTQKLLVIDPWNPYKGPFISEFLFPSCCICHIPGGGSGSGGSAGSGGMSGGGGRGGSNSVSELMGLGGHGGGGGGDGDEAESVLRIVSLMGGEGSVPQKGAAHLRAAAAAATTSSSSSSSGENSLTKEL